MGNINYDSFIKSSFFKELQSENRTTEELLNFVLSFIGLENFIKHHPKPVIDYYWRNNHGNCPKVETLAEKYNVLLKPISCGILDISNKKIHLNYIVPQRMKNVKLDEKEYPSSIPLECYDGKEDGYLDYIKDVKLKDISVYNLKNIKLIKNVTSHAIVNNEILWNENFKVDFRSERHSSDYIEHFTTYKTGWYYLSLNPNIKLDMLLISYLKNKMIVLERETMQEYMAYNTGSTYDTKIENAIMVFRNKDIDETIIPLIINDPLTWEGIFYSENFCNESILAYIKNHFHLIDDLNL